MAKPSSWKIGSAVRNDLNFEKKKGFQTAPGQYTPSTSLTKERGNAWGFGTEKRPKPGPPKHMNYPSPSSYTLPSKIVEGAKTAMHARTDMVDMAVKNNYPGAGTYAVQSMANLNHDISQKFSFGKQTRDNSPHAKEQKCKPGAGTYNGTHDTKRSSPRFGFGTSKRPDIGYKKDNTPAPGAYKVPTKIANTASYAQVKHELTYKHV
jgi:hypothetical protein